MMSGLPSSEMCVLSELLPDMNIGRGAADAGRVHMLTIIDGRLCSLVLYVPQCFYVAPQMSMEKHRLISHLC